MTKGPDRRPAIDRILARVVIDGECWLSTIGMQRNGYSSVGVGTTQKLMSHRVAYEHFHGPIPDGYEVDHLCGVRNCIRPDHIEAVTHAENIHRAVERLWRDRTTCARGHQFTSNDLMVTASGQRLCRRCYLDNNKKKVA
jgi:hypothetical protein